MTRDKAKGWNHVLYEFGMLEYTATRLLEKREQLEAEEVGVLLESFAIHARGLMCFCFPEHCAKYDTDMVASEFVRDAVAWERARGAFPAALGQVKSRINKEVAHMTWERIDGQPEAKNWDVEAIAAVFRNQWSILHEHREFYPPGGVQTFTVAKGAGVHTMLTQTLVDSLKKDQ